MCEYFNYDVLKLERIQIMNIKLDKLGQGNWRPLTLSELEGLFDMLKDSETINKGKAPNSNKAFNKALEEHDIKTNYRKSSLAGKKAGQSSGNPGKPKKNIAPSNETPEEKFKRPKSKGKPASGLRVGKQKVASNKPKAKTKPEAPKSNRGKGRMVK
jgi:23S rRNA pseudouridine2604 synthase